VGYRLLRSEAYETADLLKRLRTDPRIQFAEPNYVVKQTPVQSNVVPNDPVFTSQWALNNSGQNVQGSGGVPGADIEALSAWNLTTGSRSAVIAVVSGQRAGPARQRFSSRFR
jgi:hypothetical protein